MEPDVALPTIAEDSPPDDTRAGRPFWSQARSSPPSPNGPPVTLAGAGRACIADGESGEAWLQSSARTVTKYMHRTHHRGPSHRWRSFLRQHASTIWACDFFCVHTITFKTLYVFFVIHHASRQVLHVHVTSHPTAEWTYSRLSNAAVGTASRYVSSFMTTTAVMAADSIGGCAISVLPKRARRSDRLRPTRSPSAG